MAATYKYNQPFDWGVDHNNEYISIPTQRNAKYTKTSDGEYQGSQLDAFFQQRQPNYLQISNVCGIDCPDDGCSD